MIQQIPYETVKQFFNLAKKDKVNLKDTKTTVWFGYYAHGILRGVAGTILKHGKGRIRGVFVPENYRGKGYGQSLMKYVMRYFEQENACYVDQLASNYEWWIKQGWKIKSIVKNGAWVYKVI